MSMNRFKKRDVHIVFLSIPLKKESDEVDRDTGVKTV